MKKKFMSLIGTFVLLGGLFSCGNSTSDTIEINFWHTNGSSLMSAYQEVADDFADLVYKNEGVKIKITASYQGAYTDIENKITKSFSGGNTPTVAIAYPDHVADYLAESDKVVVNMAELATDDTVGFGKESYIGDGDSSDFVSEFYEEGTNFTKEGMYTMPFMKSSEVMIYNVDMLTRACKDYDKTIKDPEAWISSISWDDFMKFCEFIAQNKSSIGSQLDYIVSYDSDSNLFISHSYQQDIPFISIKDGKGSIDFNNTESKAMVSKLKTLHDEKVITTKGTKNTYSSVSFKTEKTMFCIGSSGGVGYSFPEAGSFSYKVCKVPTSGTKELYVSQGPSLTLLRNLKDSTTTSDLKVKYGWKFIKYLTSTDVNTKLCVEDANGYIPVRTSCYSTDLYKEYLQNGEEYATTADIVINDVNGKYLNTPFFKGSAKAREEAGGIISSVFLGSSTVDQAFASAENQSKLAM